MTAAVRLSVLAEELAGELARPWEGGDDPSLEGVATLERAGPAHLTFLANPTYRRHLGVTQAGAVILAAQDAPACPVPHLVARDPYVAYARVAGRFHRGAVPEPGVHRSAVVDATSVIDPTASIGPQAVIEAGARIGARTQVGAGSYVGRDVTIGPDGQLHPRVTLLDGVQLGARVIVHPGAVIGADGFGLAMDGGRWRKVPQLGAVRIGDDCEIGANTTIDRGAIDDTVLEEDVRLDNQIQIAHNVHIGAHTAMAGCCAVAGSARIGRYCLIGGGVGILGHLEVTDRVTVTAMSLVTRSIREPGEYSSGTPLQTNREWRRNAVWLRQLDALARTVRQLSKDDGDE